MGPPQHVGEDPQRFVEIARQGGRAEPRVRFPHRFAPLNTQAIQVVDELAAVSRAGSAERHFAGETAQTAPVGRLVNAARRHKDRERRRLQPVHRFGHEDQAVVKNVGLDHLLSGQKGCWRAKGDTTPAATTGEVIVHGLGGARQGGQPIKCTPPPPP